MGCTLYSDHCGVYTVKWSLWGVHYKVITVGCKAIGCISFPLWLGTVGAGFTEINGENLSVLLLAVLYLSVLIVSVLYLLVLILSVLYLSVLLLPVLYFSVLLVSVLYLSVLLQSVTYVFVIIISASIVFVIITFVSIVFASTVSLLPAGTVK